MSRTFKGYPIPTDASPGVQDALRKINDHLRAEGRGVEDDAPDLPATVSHMLLMLPWGAF